MDFNQEHQPNANVNMNDMLGPDGTHLSPLPMNTLQDVPTPRPDAQRIVALVKQGGRIKGYQLQNGQILNKPDAIELARQGGIRGVGIASRKGSEYLKSLPDDTEGNNLGNLPSVTE